MKPGYTTTEWWTTLVVQIISVIAIFRPSAAGLPAKYQGQLDAAAVLASALAASLYSHSRGKAKAAAIVVGLKG